MPIPPIKIGVEVDFWTSSTVRIVFARSQLVHRSSSPGRVPRMTWGLFSEELRRRDSFSSTFVLRVRRAVRALTDSAQRTDDVWMEEAAERKARTALGMAKFRVQPCCLPTEFCTTHQMMSWVCTSIETTLKTRTRDG